MCSRIVLAFEGLKRAYCDAVGNCNLKQLEFDRSSFEYLRLLYLTCTVSL